MVITVETLKGQRNCIRNNVVEVTVVKQLPRLLELPEESVYVPSLTY
jgi:hypothetical protein